MRIVIQEGKKLFPPWLLLFLLLFGIYYVHPAITNNVYKSFDHGHSDYEEFLIHKDLLETYGIALPREAVQTLEKWRDAYYRTQDAFFQNDPLMRKKGIATYEEMLQYDQEQHIDSDGDSVYMYYMDTLHGEDMNYHQVQQGYMAQAYCSMTDNLTWVFSDRYAQDMLSNAQYDYNRIWRWTPKTFYANRIAELAARTWSSNIPATMMTRYESLISDVGTVILFLLLIFSVMLPVYDTLRNMRPLQYAARCGRRLYGRQALTTVGAAASLALLLFGGFLAAFIHIHDVLPFFACDISGFDWSVYWFDMTLWQYSALHCVVLLLLSVGFALLGFLAGNLAKNYVQAAAMLVPLFLAAHFVRAFCADHLLQMTRQGKYIQILATIAFLLAALLLYALANRKNLRRDIA